MGGCGISGILERRYNMTQIEFTQVLAIWGALLSTLLGAWKIVQDLRDRGRIQVDAIFAIIVPPPPGEEMRMNFHITFTNIGSRPIWLTKWESVIRHEPNNLLRVSSIKQTLPKVLSEGEYVSDYSPNLSNFANDRVEYIHAIDSKGRSWKLPAKTLRRLKAEYKAQHNDSK